MVVPVQTVPLYLKFRLQSLSYGCYFWAGDCRTHQVHVSKHRSYVNCCNYHAAHRMGLFQAKRHLTSFAGTTSISWSDREPDVPGAFRRRRPPAAPLWPHRWSGHNTIIVHWGVVQKEEQPSPCMLLPSSQIQSKYKPYRFLLTSHTNGTLQLVLLQVWDVNVIETAMKDFYNNDLSTIVKAIQRNITVSRSAPITSPFPLH